MTSCAFKIRRESEPARGSNLHIGFFARVSHRNSRTQQFQRKPHICFDLLPTLNIYLVSFVERLMAREVRCRVTDRQTDRQTHTHDNYSYPRCVCAPRVNNTTPTNTTSRTTLFSKDNKAALLDLNHHTLQCRRVLYQLSYRLPGKLRWQGSNVQHKYNTRQRQRLTANNSQS